MAVLAALSSEEGNAFRIITNANQRISKISFLLVLLEMESYEPLADENRKNCSQSGVKEESYG